MMAIKKIMIDAEDPDAFLLCFFFGFFLGAFFVALVAAMFSSDFFGDSTETLLLRQAKRANSVQARANT
jgi:hypothetical protein